MPDRQPAFTWQILSLGDGNNWIVKIKMMRNSWIAMILLVTVILQQQQQAMSAPVTEDPMSEIEMHIHGIAQKMDVDMNMDQYKLDEEEAGAGDFLDEGGRIPATEEQKVAPVVH